MFYISYLNPPNKRLSKHFETGFLLSTVILLHQN
jgi:hypothetical protein